MPDSPRDLRATLTNTAIDALQPGQELKDDRVPGLSVRAHKSGKSFMLYYRTRAHRVRRPKIGDYGSVTLAQAREIARLWLAKVAAGEDPSGQWERERDEPTVDALAQRCEATHFNRTAWHKEAMRAYRTNVAPKIGRLRVREVTYAQIHKLHSEMVDRPIAANRTLAVISTMLTMARRWGWREGTNPCEDVTRYPERKRRRYATAIELAKIGPVLDRYANGDKRHVSGVAFLYILMFSGARPSEIERATPEMLERAENGAGILRIENGKTGQRTVYLPEQAMRVIDRLPEKRERLAGRSSLPRALWKLVREEVGCPDLWARDMRRTFATAALSSGVPIGVVGELLGHASAQTTKIYAKLMEDPALKAAAATAVQMEGMLGQRRPADSGFDRQKDSA